MVDQQKHVNNNKYVISDIARYPVKCIMHSIGITLGRIYLRYITVQAIKYESGTRFMLCYDYKWSVFAHNFTGFLNGIRKWYNGPGASAP